MKTLFILFAFLIICSWQMAHGAVSERRKSELLESLGHDSFERVDNLPDDEKKWLHEYIIELRKTPTGGGAFELQLIQLGDEEAMKRCVGGDDSAAGAAGYGYIAISRQPRLIEHLAPTMFRDEPSTLPQNSDVNTYPPSVSAAGVVAKLLSTSHEIPEPVQRWAAEAWEGSRVVPNLHRRLREVMRQWWKENETAMRARNWKAVKPGTPMIPPSKSNVTTPEKQTSLPETPLETTPPPRVGETNPLAMANPASQSSDWSRYGIAGLLAVLVVAGTIGVRRFRLRRRTEVKR